MQKALEQWSTALSELRAANFKFLVANAFLRDTISDTSVWPSNRALVVKFFDQIQAQMDTIALVERSMYKSYSLLNQLRNNSPAMVSIHRLPEELLSQVFKFIEADTECTAPPHRKYSILNTMLVCFRWRRVAVNTRSLWSHIDIRTKPYWRDFDPIATTHLEIRLKRASPGPIYVHVPFYIGASVAVEKFIPLLRPYAESINSVTICESDPQVLKMLVALCARQEPGSSLRSIAAETMPAPILWARHNAEWTTFGHSFLNLAELSLADLAPEACPSLVEIVELLSGTPNLRALRLIQIFFKPSDAICPIVSLPSLRLLELSLHPDYLSPLSSVLYPGTPGLDMRLDIGWLSAYNPLSEVQELMVRSNVVSLTLQNIQPGREGLLSAYADSSSCLKALVLDMQDIRSSYVLDEFVTWAMGTPAGSAITLKCLCITGAHLESNMMYKIQHVVSATTLSSLCFIKCCFSPEFRPRSYLEASDEESDPEVRASNMHIEARHWLSRWIKRVLVYEHSPFIYSNGEELFLKALVQC